MNDAPFARDQVLDAIDEWCKGAWTGQLLGMCWYFKQTLSPADSYKYVPNVLTSLGAELRYFWPFDEQGQSDRAMMLAFMLTWAEDGLML